MIAAGVDVGLKYTKVVIVSDGVVIAKRIGRSGGVKRALAVAKIWEETLKSVGLKRSDIRKVVATGQGKNDVPFADKFVVEAVADAWAARLVSADSVTVVDIGADQTRVVTLGKGSDIREVVMNQKCMAGLGLLVEVMAERLDLTIEEISALAPIEVNSVFVNDGCPVFAELDALELLNNNVPKNEVARAVIDMVIVRLNSILNDKIVPDKKKTVLIGGLAKNKAVIAGLAARSGIEFIVPDDAEFGCAVGAAAFAASIMT